MQAAAATLSRASRQDLLTYRKEFESAFHNLQVLFASDISNPPDKSPLLTSPSAPPTSICVSLNASDTSSSLFSSRDNLPTPDTLPNHLNSSSLLTSPPAPPTSICALLNTSDTSSSLSSSNVLSISSPVSSIPSDTLSTSPDILPNTSGTSSLSSSSDVPSIPPDTSSTPPDILSNTSDTSSLSSSSDVPHIPPDTSSYPPDVLPNISGTSSLSSSSDVPPTSLICMSPNTSDIPSSLSSPPEVPTTVQAIMNRLDNTKNRIIEYIYKEVDYAVSYGDWALDHPWINDMSYSNKGKSPAVEFRTGLAATCIGGHYLQWEKLKLQRREKLKQQRRGKQQWRGKTTITLDRVDSLCGDLNSGNRSSFYKEYVESYGDHYKDPEKARRFTAQGVRFHVFGKLYLAYSHVPTHGYSGMHHGVLGLLSFVFEEFRRVKYSDFPALAQAILSSEWRKHAGVRNEWMLICLEEYNDRNQKIQESRKHLTELIEPDIQRKRQRLDLNTHGFEGVRLESASNNTCTALLDSEGVNMNNTMDPPLGSTTSGAGPHGFEHVMSESASNNTCAALPDSEDVNMDNRMDPTLGGTTSDLGPHGFEGVISESASNNTCTSYPDFPDLTPLEEINSGSTTSDLGFEVLISESASNNTRISYPDFPDLTPLEEINSGSTTSDLGPHGFEALISESASNNTRISYPDFPDLTPLEEINSGSIASDLGEPLHRDIDRLLRNFLDDFKPGHMHSRSLLAS